MSPHEKEGELEDTYSMNVALRVLSLHWNSHGNSFCVGWYIRQASSLALAGLLVYLSVPVVQNLLSSRQLMNTSFHSFRIVNTYGAFGRWPLLYPPVSGQWLCVYKLLVSIVFSVYSKGEDRGRTGRNVQQLCGSEWRLSSSVSRGVLDVGHASSHRTTTAWTGSCGCCLPGIQWLNCSLLLGYTVDSFTLATFSPYFYPLLTKSKAPYSIWQVCLVGPGLLFCSITSSPTSTTHGCWTWLGRYRLEIPRSTLYWHTTPLPRHPPSELMCKTMVLSISQDDTTSMVFSNSAMIKALSGSGSRMISLGCYCGVWPGVYSYL